MVAHAAHGNVFGVPEWLLVSALIVVIALTWLSLRTSWPKPVLAAADANSRVLPPWTATAATVLAAVVAVAGLVVWALTLTAGLFATEDAVENLAPFIVNLQLLLGAMLLAAVVGDWWRAASPFTNLARLVPDRHATADPALAPPWTGPVMLASFLWLVTCYHNGGEPRAVGFWLLAYTLAVLGGAAAWGRAWTTTGEGFAVLLTAIARMAPLARDRETGRVRLRPPLSGLAGDLPPGTPATCLLMIGAVAFGAIRRLDWWQLDVMGARSGWERTIVDTVGLVFTVGVAAVIWLAASHQLARTVARPLVPLTLGISTAFLLTDFLTRLVDAVALLSDPYGRDWDLFGTADWFPDIAWQTSTRLAWAEVIAIALGAVLSVVVAHDTALATEKSRARAEQVLLPQLAAGTVLATAALLILLQ